MQLLKDFRQQIDATRQLIDNLPKSRNTEMASTSAQKAKEWIGKMLGEIQAPSPYKAEHKGPADIAPTADTSGPVVPEGWDEMSEVAKLDYLRKHLGQLVDEWKHTNEFEPSSLVNYTNGRLGTLHYVQLQRDQVYVHLSDARMALGNSLADIRNNYQAMLAQQNQQAEPLELPKEIELTPVPLTDIPTDGTVLGSDADIDKVFEQNAVEHPEPPVAEQLAKEASEPKLDLQSLGTPEVPAPVDAESPVVEDVAEPNLPTLEVPQPPVPIEQVKPGAPEKPKESALKSLKKK